MVYNSIYKQTDSCLMKRDFFKYSSLRKNPIFLSASLVFVVVIGALLFKTHHTAGKNIFSSEIGISESSPAGDAGGAIIPASCASNLHDDPWYGTPCTQCNICGSCNVGAYQCTGNPVTGSRWWSSFFLQLMGIQSWSPTGGGSPGACSVGAPAVPLSYGATCFACNACGNCNTGTYNCSGVCSAVAPLNTGCNLAICQDACNAGASSIRSTGGVFTVASGSTATLKACYYDGSAITPCTGGNDVTGSTSWTDTNTPKDVAYFTTPGNIIARFLNGQEILTARYGSFPDKTATIQSLCISNSCGPLTTKSITDSYCPNETRDTGVSDSCGGTLTCPGTRYCDNNWKEVAP